MKKTLLSFILIGLSATNAFAQQESQMVTSSSNGSGLYFGVHGGYNLGIAKREISFFELENIHEYTNGDEKYESILTSLGEGANFGINIGYMFNKNMGAELGVDYFSGSKTEGKYTSDDYPGSYFKQTISGKMVQLNPSVVVRGNMGKVNPYGKLGIVIGVAPKVEYMQDTNFNGSMSERDIELEEGTPIGISGAAGVEFNIQPKMSIFAEIRTVNMSYAPNRGRITKYTIEGENILPELDVEDREIEFVDSYVDDGTDDQNQPEKTTRITFPFSNVGINIGFKYTL